MRKQSSIIIINNIISKTSKNLYEGCLKGSQRVFLAHNLGRKIISKKFRISAEDTMNIFSVRYLEFVAPKFFALSSFMHVSWFYVHTCIYIHVYYYLAVKSIWASKRTFLHTRSCCQALTHLLYIYIYMYAWNNWKQRLFVKLYMW